MQKKLQVFISSTYTDLKKERQAAVEVILRAGHIPAGMELFAAGDKSQMEVIRSWIDASDIFLLILGGRYGSIEPESGKSYVQIEYEYALSKLKPWFACVIHKDELDRRRKLEDYENYCETKNSDKLESFRSKLTSQTLVQFWNDRKDIKLSIFQSLTTFSNRSDIQGWIKNTIDFESIMRESLANRSSYKNFHERSHVQHHLIHQVRDMSLQMMPRLTYQPPVCMENQPAKAHPSLKKNESKIIILLERVVQLFQLLVPTETRIWACLRDRRADDCYHTFARAGRYNTNRSSTSKAMHKDKSIVIQKLKNDLKFNGVCVTISGSVLGPQAWEPQKNDNYNEDKSVMLGAVLLKSWDTNINKWSEHKLVWIIGVCADSDNAFNSMHIPLMQSCVDMFSMLANTMFRNSAGLFEQTNFEQANIEVDQSFSNN